MHYRSFDQGIFVRRLLPQLTLAIRMGGAGIFLSGGGFGWVGGFCVSFPGWRFSETLLNVYYPNNRHRGSSS
jgi:hypothetical protein